MLLSSTPHFPRPPRHPLLLERLRRPLQRRGPPGEVHPLLRGRSGTVGLGQVRGAPGGRGGGSGDFVWFFYQKEMRIQGIVRKHSNFVSNMDFLMNYNFVCGSVAVVAAAAAAGGGGGGVGKTFNLLFFIQNNVSVATNRFSPRNSLLKTI